jgi:predicted small secreted protein
MKELILLPCFIVITASLLLCGCNTVKGLGEDISGSATYVQGKMNADGTTQSSDAQYVQNPPQFPKTSN